MHRVKLPEGLSAFTEPTETEYSLSAATGEPPLLFAFVPLEIRYYVAVSVQCLCVCLYDYVTCVCLCVCVYMCVLREGVFCL